MTDLRGLLRLVACLCLSGAVEANPVGIDLDAWRTEVDAVRLRAENDATRAYAEAQRLETALAADAPPADRARSLNLLAHIELYLADTEAADRHADAALELARRHGDKIGQAEANLSIALNAINQGRIEAAAEAIPDALAALDGANRPDLLSEALLRAAMMHRRKGQFEESVATTMQAMEIAQLDGSPLALAHAHQGLATAYEHSGRYREAAEQYQKMREQTRRAGSRLREAYALQGLGVMQANLGDFRAAEAAIRAAIDSYRAINTPFNVSFGLAALASVKRMQGQLEEAVALLDAAAENYRRHPNKIGQWWILHMRGGDQLALGRTAAAITEAETALALARDIGFPLYLAESHRALAAAAAARGDHQRAYALVAEAERLTKEAERSKTGEQMVRLAARYQSEAKQRRIDELQRRERRQELEYRWLATLLAASLALLALTAYFLLRLRRSRAQIQALNAGLEQRVQERTDELRQQTRYLRTLIDTLPVRVWLKDTEGRYLTINNPEAAIDGHSAREMIGKTDLELWPGEVGAAHRAADLEVMETRRPLTAETVWNDDAREVWMEIDKAPVVDEDGTPLGTVGVARDIGERRAAERMREAALAEAVRLARLRGDFLAQMSHELRTPLNGILGHAQMLQRNSALAERQRASVDIIRACGEHLLAIIDDLLDMARIEAGKLELVSDDVPLAELLHVVGDIVEVNARQKGVAFVCALSTGLPAIVRTDGKRLRQVLLNLLSNAVKFTAAGQVALSVDRPAPARLRFSVRDSGSGIAADKLESIFQPFEQAGDAQQRRGGTGLGLPISRQLVRMMGGDIGVESQPGAGSTFWFEIDAPPVGDSAGPAGTQAAPLPAADIAANVPPKTEMDTLHRLALAGNMRDIHRQAGHIATLAPAYGPFADHLRQLADNFQSKAILAFIERHRHESTD